jgi:hypothetical protein
MKYLIVLGSVVMLQGCAGALQLVANSYNHADPCQSRAELKRPPGYQIPNWCGAGGGRVLIYNTSNEIVGYTKK